MTATLSEWKRIGTDAWEIQWTGDDDFRIYLDGVYIDGQPTGDTSRVFIVTDGEEPPPIEVLDSTQTGDPDNIVYAPVVILQWRAFTGAQYYLVQKYIGSTWTTQRTVSEAGRGYYHYTSSALEDLTTHQYRIVAVDADGNQNTATTFAGLMVRNPPPPSITLAWDADNTEIDITARA